jgi:hypothetical protein
MVQECRHGVTAIKNRDLTSVRHSNEPVITGHRHGRHPSTDPQPITIDRDRAVLTATDHPGT